MKEFLCKVTYVIDGVRIDDTLQSVTHIAYNTDSSMQHIEIEKKITEKVYIQNYHSIYSNDLCYDIKKIKHLVSVTFY